MDNTNILIAVYAEGGPATTDPLYQWDYNQILQLEGFPNLPETFEMHFAAVGSELSQTMIGTNGQVDIPNGLLTTGQWIDAWLYLHAEENSGETEYHISIPVYPRARPSDQATPEQESAVNQAIAALNAGVARAETAAAHAEASETAAAASAAQASGSAATSYEYAERAEDAEGAAQAHAQSAQESEGAAQGYAAAAADSAASAEQSAERAEQAAATAGYLDMYIDEEGYLCYVRTPQVSIDFELDEQGYLVMKGA